VVAITRSPSACLGVLSQTRAVGPLARFSLAFIMASDVVVVVVLATALTVARPLLEPGSTFSFSAFSSLGHEILGSISLGTTLGLVLAAYLRVSGRQLLVVLIALGFGATEVLHYLNYEPLLTFMVAGFVVQNLSKQGDKFIHAIEETGGVVYVVFFASAGAHLNVPLLKDYWSTALILVISRAAVSVGTARLSAVLAKDVPSIKNYGWGPLISQAGVAIGIASVIAAKFPLFGAGFRDVAIACVALNEMVGPILFKMAIDRAKETQAPTPTLEDEDAPAPSV
jgi:Kef-type K+ transport system membrane component KefB